jgi:hypothetical protein
VPDLAMSGMVRLSSVEDDFYVFDNLRNHLVGRRSRVIIALGDRVVVQIAQVDTFKKQVNFRLVETPKAGARREPTERRREGAPRDGRPGRFGGPGAAGPGFKKQKFGSSRDGGSVPRRNARPGRATPASRAGDRRGPSRRDEKSGAAGRSSGRSQSRTPNTGNAPRPTGGGQRRKFRSRH